ncbi:MAG TPA: hypothetical protein PLV92_26030, partial [Pirellulaceae bacterium]|nr:hypothetical protein [Pirellulaceae bacterium]
VVTTQWVTWHKLIWLGSITVGIVLFVAMIIYFFNRRLTPRRVAPALDEPPLEDLEDGDVRPMTRIPERAAKVGGDSGSRDGASAASPAGDAAIGGAEAFSSTLGFGGSSQMLRPDDSSGEDSSALRP